MHKLEVKEIIYGEGNQITSIIFKNEKGGTTQSFVNEDVCLSNVDPKEVYVYLHENYRSKSFNVIPINEEMTIKLALDRDKIKDIERSNDIDKMYGNKLNYINIVVYEQNMRYPWILVMLPKEIDGIRYVPIILDDNSNKRRYVCVHPDYHKVFIKSFTEKERHCILGFIYLYGPSMMFDARVCYDRNKNLSEKEHVYQIYSNFYDENKVPNRIPTFKRSDVKGLTYDFIIDNYEEWMMNRINKTLN